MELNLWRLFLCRRGANEESTFRPGCARFRACRVLLVSLSAVDSLSLSMLTICLRPVCKHCLQCELCIITACRPKHCMLSFKLQWSPSCLTRHQLGGDTPMQMTRPDWRRSSVVLQGSDTVQNPHRSSHKPRLTTSCLGTLHPMNNTDSTSPASSTA